MPCVIKRKYLSLWLVLIVGSGICQADSGLSLNPLSLESHPCLVSVSKTEYEWGTMDSDLCRGIDSVSAFTSIDNYDIQKKILWSNGIANPERPPSQCLRYRGHFNRFLETGESDCLCSGLQANGLYDIGVEQKGRNGTLICTTRNQSFSEYLVARPNSTKISEEIQVPESSNTLGYVLYGSIGLILVAATCDIFYGINLINWSVSLVLALFIVIRYQDLSLLKSQKN